MTMWRSRWAAIGAAMAVALGGGGVGLVGATASSGERPVTITVEPTRILDSRVDLGLAGRFVNETPRDLQVTGEVSIAPSGTATVVPDGAVAVLVNVTVVFPDSPGFLALRPGGAAGVPSTSNVNWLASGAIEPNAATVDLADDGTMQVYVKTASPTGTAHVLVDVVGYTVDHDHDDRYYTEDEVDALVDSIPAGPEGPQGPPGPSAADYENVIVVAKSGGDFTSVTAAMNAIGVDPDYPASSSSNRYLVWVAPGVYEGEDVDMQPYVDIEGSGQGVTVLRSSGGGGGIHPDNATLVGADNAELRHVTVEIEAANPANWSFAIYTAKGTTFKNVTTLGTGGTHARGMLIDAGARAIMIDLIAIANGATDSNFGLDLVLGEAFADGLFATASGGDVARGIYINSAGGEVQFENVTAHARDGVVETTSLRSDNSHVTLEGYRSLAVGESAGTYGLRCFDETYSMKVLDATIYTENSSATGAAVGAEGFDCNLEVRNAVIDAVAAGGRAYGVLHTQSDAVDPANVTISDVESRAESGGSSAYGLRIAAGIGTPAGTYGRVTDFNARATGGSESVDTWAINHTAAGEVHYRGLSLIAGGSAAFLYGIQTEGDGIPRFDDVVIDAIGEAGITTFGVEFFTDGSTLTNARVTSVNTGAGSGRDAVGVKANGAQGVTFTDVTAYAEGETNVWGADLVSSDTRLVRVDTRAVSTLSGVALGTRCVFGSTEIHDSLFRGESSSSSSYGFNSDDCNSTIFDSELVGDGSSTNYGLYAESTSGTDTTFVRGSYLAGSTNSVHTLGAGTAEVEIVMSQLDGGAGSELGSSSQECTAVTYNSGGGEAFDAGPTSPCP